MMRLVSFMEESLGIPVDDLELLAENFASLRTLDEFIARKKQQSPSGGDGSAAEPQ